MGSSKSKSKDTEKFKMTCKRLRHNLPEMIHLHYGLLDTLLARSILTHEQVVAIQEQNTHRNQVFQLVDTLRWEIYSTEKKKQFFKTLDQTQHKHVSNFLRGNGHYTPEFADDWPLTFRYEQVTGLDKCRVNFIELIDSKSGLLDEMLSQRSINNQQKHEIESKPADEERNKILFLCVRRGSLATYNNFIDCLKSTKQHHVVSILAPHLARDMRPLSEEHMSRLQNNHATLVQMIDTENGLLSELLAADCINWRQQQYIESTTTHCDRTGRLLDIVRRGSETSFNRFLHCLDRTGQRHISCTLREDGIVAHIVATISSGANNVEDSERRIVDNIMALLQHLPETPGDGKQQIIDRVQELLTELRNRGVPLIAAKKGNSIGLFYFCTSLSGLQYLRELYSSGQLKLMMEEVFILLLGTSVHFDTVLGPGDRSATVHVDTVTWTQTNYTKCTFHLCESAGLAELSHVYRMAQHKVGQSSSVPDEENRIDWLPYELIEMIVIRAASHLFVTINRRTSRAEVYTLVTLSAVSLMWHETLSYRTYNKRLLKRSFKRVCHPFKCSPQQVTRLHIEGSNYVRGVAVLNNELFVACRRSNKIQVFDSRPPFSRQEDIHVEGLEYAIDITVCNKSSSLFIADSMQRAIWRVNLLTAKPTDKFLAMQWRPLSLSVNNSRLLITPYDGDSLYLYGDDGNELHHIELPQYMRYMRATNAVETTDKTYLVSHYNRFLQDTSLHLHNVSEVDVNGRVVRSFNDHIDLIQFNYPYYMLLDNNHVIIADTDNDRIILLKSNLQLKRILINSLHGERPYGLCLTSSRLLAVCYYNSTDIDFYQV